MLELLGLAAPRDAALFALAVLVLNATPGVDLLLTVTRTLQHGSRAGIAVALGVTTGCVVHVLAAAFGVAALLAASAQAFVLLKVTGAAYLLWLAVGMAQRAWRPPRAEAVPPAPSGGTHFRDGVLTNVLNPKVALFFLAFVPQFIAPGAPHKVLAFLALGGLALLQGLLFLGIVVALISRLRQLWPRAVRPRAARVLYGAAAILFAGLAARLMAAKPA